MSVAKQLAILTALAPLVAGAAAPAAAISMIQPHRAVYEMSLDRSASGAGITDMSGRLVFEVTGSQCDGYSVNMRFVSQIQSEARSTTSDLRSATYEAGDGSTYRFLSRSFFDDSLSDETDGVATREEDSIAVDLTKPEEADFQLPGDVLFPTQHVRHIISAAEAGERLVSARVYDGSDTGRKTYDTTTVIGEARGAETEAEHELLGGIDSWPVTIAYFDSSEAEAETPTYEFSYRIYANGISSRIVLDYGDFALSGDLDSLELVDAGECEQ